MAEEKQHLLDHLRIRMPVHLFDACPPQHLIPTRFLSVLLLAGLSFLRPPTIVSLTLDSIPHGRLPNADKASPSNIMPPSSSSSSSPQNVMHWFRKGLRLTDNPALVACLEQLHKEIPSPPSTTKKDATVRRRIYPVYVVDGNSYQLFRCSALRANFLVECLQDLDRRLRQRGSRLYVLEGDPTVVLPQQWKSWNISHVSFEEDETGEPYATQRDETIIQKAQAAGINVFTSCSETLYPLQDYVAKAGSPNKPVPNTMTAFQKLFEKMPSLKQPLPAPTEDDFPDAQEEDDTEATLFLPPQRPTDLPWPRDVSKSEVEPIWDANDCQNLKPLVHGGETAALKALETKLKDANWVATFEKPQTNPTALQPSTTALSPYLSWGCLSPRQVWTALDDAIARSTTSKRSTPPVSLHGQVLWRDFNNLMAHDANNEEPGCWNHMEGNKYCRQIPWDDDPRLLQAWKDGQTGFPWIDAAMRQLKTEGWMHHLARHAVACFLTRGDLWQSWEEGAKHFEGQLLDADYALNGFNWLWLSCSGFFYQYFRCYSPIAFQKKNDPNGNYIRKYVPELKDLPSKYIYEPWTAPAAILQKAGVKLGSNYPRPLVDHTVISKENMSRMKQAYDAHKALAEATKKSGTSSEKPPKKKQRKT